MFLVLVRFNFSKSALELKNEVIQLFDVVREVSFRVRRGVDFVRGKDVLQAASTGFKHSSQLPTKPPNFFARPRVASGDRSSVYLLPSRRGTFCRQSWLPQNFLYFPILFFSILGITANLSEGLEKTQVQTSHKVIPFKLHIFFTVLLKRSVECVQKGSIPRRR